MAGGEGGELGQVGVPAGGADDDAGVVGEAGADVFEGGCGGGGGGVAFASSEATAAYRRFPSALARTACVAVAPAAITPSAIVSAALLLCLAHASESAVTTAKNADVASGIAGPVPVIWAATAARALAFVW